MMVTFVILALGLAMLKFFDAYKIVKEPKDPKAYYETKKVLRIKKRSIL